jgi:isopenicillin N synthase-like dioxygenase
VDKKYAEVALEQAQRFFALPEEKKMEVFTGLVPNEYVGYHPMKCYNRNGWKHQGKLSRDGVPLVHMLMTSLRLE